MLLDDLTAQARLLLAGAPVLGSLQIEAAQSARPEQEREAVSAPIPVALIEPLKTARVPLNGPGGRTYDVRTAISAKLGLHHLGLTRATVPPAAKWIFEYGNPSALIDPTGACLATFTIPDDPEWLSHASRHGTVAVIYGANVGVQRPGNIPPAIYDDTARAIELHNSRRDGAVTGGLVAFIAR